MVTDTEIVLLTEDQALVEDMEAILDPSDLALSKVLGPAGFEKLAIRKAACLYLVDGHLGPEPAVDLCRALRNEDNAHKVGILVLVANVDDELVSSLLEASADDVVSRKLRPWGLIARLRSHLQRIETARKLERKVRDSNRLIEVTSKLVGSEDLLGNLYSMAYLLSTELEVDRCSVVLLRNDRKHGIVIASSDDPKVNSLLIDLGRYPEIIRVAENGKPLVVPDVSDSEILEEVLPNLRSLKVSSVALFPIVDEGRVQGVIFLRFTGRKEKFEQRELVFCQTVANATAIALRNNEVLESLKAKTVEVQQVQNEARSKLAALKPYEDFFTNSAEGMVVLSDSGVVLFINPEGVTMLDREISAIRGLPFGRLLEAQEHGRLDTLLEDGARGVKRSSDFLVTTRDGLEHTFSISASSLGAEGMMLLTMRDVTDDRITARRLMEAQDRLIENEKQSAMMEVAGAAAHELNQPLTSVLTSVAMMRRLQEGQDERFNKLINIVEGEVERMAAIIRRLSKLTEYSTKSYVGQAKIIDLERASDSHGSDRENK